MLKKRFYEFKNQSGPNFHEVPVTQDIQSIINDYYYSIIHFKFLLTRIFYHNVYLIESVSLT